MLSLIDYREFNEAFAAGCRTIGIHPCQEAKAAKPREVIGLTDLPARVFISKKLGDNLLTVAVPRALFAEMEQNAPGSFLERHTSQSLIVV